MVGTRRHDVFTLPPSRCSRSSFDTLRSLFFDVSFETIWYNSQLIQLKMPESEGERWLKGVELVSVLSSDSFNRRRIKAKYQGVSFPRLVPAMCRVKLYAYSTHAVGLPIILSHYRCHCVLVFARAERRTVKVSFDCLYFSTFVLTKKIVLMGFRSDGISL